MSAEIMMLLKFSVESQGIPNRQNSIKKIKVVGLILCEKKNVL
jgi:hypothetical protein